jgi:hypothetical protein
VPPVVIPVETEVVAAEEMLGPEGLGPVTPLGPVLPRVQLAALPPQLLTVAPVPVPVILPPPPPPPVVQEVPPVYVPPLRPRKQDRN